MQQLLLLSTTLLLSLTAAAQDVFVTGTITDADGAPLIGAYVQYAPGFGTVTDLEGYFALTTPKKGTLTVSYVGYANGTIKIGTEPEQVSNLTMNAGIDLETVVIIGYQGFGCGHTICCSCERINTEPIVEIPPFTPPLSYLQSATVSPNPFVRDLAVTFTSATERTVTATLVDAAGRLVEHWPARTVNAPQHTLHLRPRPGRLLPGAYFLQLRDEEGRTEVRQVIKVD